MSEATNSPSESPVLIHVWKADPAQQDVAIERLDNMFSGIATDPGFVSARVLKSIEGNTLAALVEMRSVEDRKRLEQLPDVRETLGQLPGTFNLIFRLYHEVQAYRT